MSTLTVISQNDSQSDSAQVPVPYSIGFFGTEDTNFATLLEKEEAVLLFLNKSKEELDNGKAVLENQLRLFLSQSINQNVKFLWINNPLDPLYEWQTNTLSVEKIGDDYQVSALTYFDIRNYSFSISKGCHIRLNSAKDAFLIQQIKNKEAFELATAYGEHRIHSILEKKEGDKNNVEKYRVKIPIEGGSIGCLKFDLSVEKKGPKNNFSYPKLTQLDIGFRLFMRDSNFPESGDDFYLDSHRYPLFDEVCTNEAAFDFYPTTLSFSAVLDPLNPLVPSRSHFLVNTLAAGKSIPSGYRTNMGRTVHLVPKTESKLIFAESPVLLAERNTADLYLVPTNDFEIRVPDYAKKTDDSDRDENIICGISGVEYIKIPKDKTGVFSFRPHQPAFAASFNSSTSLLRDLPALLDRHSKHPKVLMDALAKVENSADLDMPIGNGTGEHLGIGLQTNELLERVKLDYFPVGFEFSETEKTDYLSQNTVEELVIWLWQTLMAITTVDADGKKEGLSDKVTTSWAYVRTVDKTPTIYYAQPDQAILHQADKDDPNSDKDVVSNQFLPYLEVPAVGLPNQQNGGEERLTFPMLPYGAVDGNVLTDLEQLERKLISNLRRRKIQEILAAEKAAPTSMGEGAAELIGTTPQGLVATIAKDYKTWTKLLLAKDTKNEEIFFKDIDHGSPLKGALQSNQLFMVLSKKTAIKKYFDSNNTLTIQGWGFVLDPDNWAKKGAKPGTILIFKYQQQPLIELAANPESWSLPDEFNEDTIRTSNALVKLLQEAIDANNSGDEKLKRKYKALATAASQASWTGILALNVHVPMSELPADLKALAAGIDPEKFYSQYVGIELTPVKATDGVLTTEQSSLFGLIDYQNNEIPIPDKSGYNFQVKQLTVVFQNSKIVDFAAEILVLVDKLFDEPAQLLDSSTGKNIISLKGTAETHGTKTTYSFGFSGTNRFKLPKSKTIAEVEIIKAQFATDPIGGTAPEKDTPAELIEIITIKGRFFFWGYLRFHHLTKFDVLGFGPEPAVGDVPGKDKYLVFSNLQLVMSFVLKKTTLFILDENGARDKDEKGRDVVDQVIAKVEQRIFTFDPNQLAFDFKQSEVRDFSLYRKFPLKIKSFRYVKDDPDALSSSGFMPVKSPVSGKLGNTWYGFTYDLNLGSVGALAGKAGIVVSLLIAWSPSTDKTGKDLYIGLKLPGSSGGKKEIVIQGIFKIVFKSIQFVVYPIDPGEHAVEGENGYILKIKNIKIKFFVLSLPPSGQTEIILFGDPRDVAQEDQLLGWYAAYAKQ